MSDRADALLVWYDAVRRPLPWRSTRDPYALLVSEVMLQQTQAARVVPYYEAFLARFPDPAALAAAPARDVLAAWSGLGYNRRALALQAAARVVAARGWPADLTELLGVGPYTAAAIASFAWDAQRAAVDVNARRVIERWDGRRRTPRPLAARAAELLPPRRAAAWNQAMIELGATVCTARAPRCDACPVAAWCTSAGAPAAAPPAAAPRPRFEDTDRYARGRIVAALLEDRALPALDPERLERALAGLARDGLIVRDAAGTPALP
ncbi:MAG TPA: A/G-specific adenine glycosylase [Solirubrobacteraceae bacterium]|nr:A/G-specific adenine glycosylase [Solirubrobacteraceae bacterium]